jgi:hypothetical protein
MTSDRNPGNASATDASAGNGRLFAAAQDLARRRGWIGGLRRADQESSYSLRASYVLKDSAGQLIGRLPLPSVQRVAERRRRRLVAALQGMVAELGPAAEISAQRAWLRRQSPDIRAVAWAYCSGGRLPEGEPFRGRKRWIALLLLLAGILPGLLYLGFGIYRARLHRISVREVVTRWQRGGSRIPYQDMLAEVRDDQPPSTRASGIS